MSSQFQLQAVIEAPYYQGEFQCPWAVPPFKSLSLIRLSAEMTYQEIGLVFAQLVQYNNLDLLDEQQAVLGRVLGAKSLVLPGGLQVVCKNEVIPPSCCCGIETWREWQGFLKTGQSPWLGHDPSPWLQKRGDLIRIWADGGLGESVKDVFCVDISHSTFQEELRMVEKDLQTFLYCIHSWAQEIGFEQSNNLFQKFDQCFDIGRRYTELPG